MVFSDPAEGSDGAIRMCREIYMADPDLYFYPDQYNNPANWKAHFEHTGPEIIEQTGGRLTHFVAAMGTSGTFTGVTRRLRRDLPEVKCYSAQPSSGFHGLEGLKHMPTAIVPGIYDDKLADGNLWIETEDAYRMVRRLAREEGLLVGISSGCNVCAATLLAQGTGGARRIGDDRHRALRQRREIPERTLLGRGMIRIEPEPWAAMVAHARQAYPNECCGAMLGSIDGDAKDGARRRCRSKTPSKARRPRATNCGPRTCWPPTRPPANASMDLIGIYHSHPDCDAYFSKTDLQNSCPWYSFVVLSIQKGEFDHANSWLPNSDQTEAAKRS